MKKIEFVVRWCLAALLLFAGAVAVAQVDRPDSTRFANSAALAQSNCLNITNAWYGPGQVPSGYYKQVNQPYECRPIPACPGNQIFTVASESCGCPSGTVWDAPYNTCHAPCPGGTAWDGASCKSICSSTQVWNGSSCVSTTCPWGQSFNYSTFSCQNICGAGQAWNGSSCVSTSCPWGQSFNYSTYSCQNNCGGGQAWNGSSCVSTSCPSGQTFDYGSYTCKSVCGGSDVWNGSSCVSTSCPSGQSFDWGSYTCKSVCGAGQTWNGSTCVSSCPAGQVWNGSQCVTAASPNDQEGGVIFIWYEEWDGGQGGNVRHYASIIDYSVKNEAGAKRVAEGSGYIPPDGTLSQYRWTWTPFCKGQSRRSYNGYYQEGYTPDGWYLGYNYPPYHNADAFDQVTPYTYFDDSMGYPVDGACFRWRI